MGAKTGFSSGGDKPRPSGKMAVLDKGRGEEVRIQDYIHAYQTTGRPPQPCPQTPADPTQRAAIGLPPLFEPLIEGNAQSPLKSTPPARAGSSSKITTIPTTYDALPDVQVFVPSPDSSENGQAMHLQSITCQAQFSHFSFEELRSHAYRSGKLSAPEATAATPSAVVPAMGPNDKLCSISGQPPYDRHSLEELRLAYYRSHREMTSEEIIRFKVL